MTLVKYLTKKNDSSTQKLFFKIKTKHTKSDYSKGLRLYEVNDCG